MTTTKKLSEHPVADNPSKPVTGDAGAPVGTWSGEMVAPGNLGADTASNSGNPHPEPNSGTTPRRRATDHADTVDMEDEATQKVERAPVTPPQETTSAASAEEARVDVRHSQAPPAPKLQPLLASRLLLEDYAPYEPGRMVLRNTAIAAGLFGAIGSVILGLTGVVGVVSAMGLLCIAILGALKLGYTARATAIALVAMLSLGIAAWFRARAPGLHSGPWLAVGTSVLAGSLLFRADYRSSATARVLVGISVSVCAIWLAIVVSTALDFSMLSTQWQSWLPAVLWLCFGMLLLLSLLAFMEAQTTGGCRIWSIALLVWYAAYVSTEFAVRTWAVDTPSAQIATAFRGFSPPPEAGAYSLNYGALTLAVALLTALGALSLWQTFVASASHMYHRRSNEDIVRTLMSK